MTASEGLRIRVLRFLARLVHRMAWPIIVSSVLLAVGSIYVAKTKLTFTGNPNDLLRSDATTHRAYLDYTQEFRAEEDYVIVVEGPDFQRNRACVEYMVERLKARPELYPKIFYKKDLSVLEDRGLLFLNVKDLEEIDSRIAEFTGMLGKNELKLDFTSLLSVASVRLDPKNLRKKENEEGMEAFMEEFVRGLDALADRLEAKATPAPPSFGNFLAQSASFSQLQAEREFYEYDVLDKGRLMIIRIPSSKEEASFGEHAEFIDPMRAIIREARQQFPDIEMGLTGEPVLSEDEAQASEQDTTASSMVTFALIALLFFVAFRGFGRIGFTLGTLILSVTWSVGFAALTVGHLNILSITFFPMILGLGIDFGIQILGRYEEEFPKTNDPVLALAETLKHTGNAIITGASTTAVAFYTMCFNDFQGLAEMGWISGTGVLFCVVSNLIVLPAFLSLWDHGKRGLPTESSKGTSRKGLLFDRIVLDHAWLIIVIAVAMTIVAVIQIPRLWFDYNLLNLQNRELESVQFERKLVNNREARSIILAASVCSSLQEAIDRSKRFSQLPTVHEVVSLTTFIPEDQDTKLQIIKRIKSRLENIKIPPPDVKVNVTENLKVLRTLKANCERLNRLARTWASKERAEEAQAFFGRLIPPMTRAIQVLETMDQKKAEKILTVYETQMFRELRKNLEWLKKQRVDRALTEHDVPQVFKEQYIGKTGKILLEIYPKENVWDREPLERFIQDIRKVDPKVTGTPVQNYEYIELLRKSYEQAAIHAFIAIVVLIALHFRTLKYVIPTLLPLALGMVWTVGAMPLLGISFNPANIITLPLVIGIGVAYGVYAVDRYRENLSPALFSTSTGKAIVLSALTTLFGFGSLAFASHRGIASLGLLMSLGVSMCLVTSLYVCPAVLKVLGRRKLEVDAKSP